MKAVLIACLFCMTSPLWAAPGFLGLFLDDVVKEDVEALKLPGEYGAKVRSVTEDAPAAKAEMAEDDVIVAYNGQRVESAAALQRMVRETPAGRQVRLSAVRDGKEMEVEVTLGTPTGSYSSSFQMDWGGGAVPDRLLEEHPWLRERMEQARTPIPRSRWTPPGRSLGAEVSRLDPQLRRFLQVEEGQGVYVERVMPDSPGEAAGLKEEDIVLELAGQPVGSPGEIRARLRELKEPEVLVRVLRQGERVELKVKFPEEPEKPAPHPVVKDLEEDEEVL